MQKWIAYFPGRDGIMGDAYGPFSTLENARRYAKVLSVDPSEGKIARIITPPRNIEEAEKHIEEVRKSWRGVGLNV